MSMNLDDILLVAASEKGGAQTEFDFIRFGVVGQRCHSRNEESYKIFC